MLNLNKCLVLFFKYFLFKDGSKIEMLYFFKSNLLSIACPKNPFPPIINMNFFYNIFQNKPFIYIIYILYVIIT